MTGPEPLPGIGGPDPRKLVYFATIVEQGSLKRAAALLDVTQPALTHSLHRLESEIGHRLLERSPAGVRPTALGDRIYGHARQIRDELEQIRRHLRFDPSVGPTGLRFGVLPSLSAAVIPAAVAQWRGIYPDRPLEVVQKVQIELLEALMSRELDFIIGVTDIYDLLEGLRQRVLFRERLYVIAKHGHPLVAKASLAWKDLAVFPWITPPAGRHRPLLEQILQAEGLSPPVATTFSASISMLKSLVAGGDSLAILPLHAVREEIAEGRLVCLPITSPMLLRNIAVFMREGMALTVDQAEFIECARSAGLEQARQSG